ncbi:hypothetical protein QBC37DRAFT_414080 [Rhypophila decipiens]|uniref:Uncharacterized protein n=1 Tax=Rhypophila decipiens TaxID=261697 RepID=A0AAN6YG45_9PEZI|nr:hypothetical protein QBC37DRAFT_414080 [Rhypophila decipiens]
MIQDKRRSPSLAFLEGCLGLVSIAFFGILFLASCWVFFSYSLLLNNSVHTHTQSVLLCVVDLHSHTVRHKPLHPLGYIYLIVIIDGAWDLFWHF